MEAFDGDCEVFRERADRFVRHSAGLVRALVAASARGDARTMAKAARELGRCSATVGASRLRAMCVALEGALSDERLLDAIGRELANVEFELREMIDSTMPRFI